MYSHYKKQLSMTKREKIKEKFLENPTSLPVNKIINFLLSEWYEVTEAKWSHTKVVHTETMKYVVVPLHNGDCKPFYKKELKKLYLSNK